MFVNVLSHVVTDGPVGLVFRINLKLETCGGSGGMMTTARPGLPYPCSPQAKTRGESSRRGK